MKPLSSYFTDEAIIHELARLFVRESDKQKDKTRHLPISPNRRRKPNKSQLSELFPSRRAWYKFRIHHNRGKYSKERVKLITITNAVRVLLKLHPSKPWAIKLMERVTEIRYRALYEIGFHLDPPRVIGLAKNPAKHEYRPIAIYPVDDKIICRIAARYFRDMFDPYLSDSSMAYRGRHDMDHHAFTHHDGMLGIRDFRSRHSVLYVTEADIRNYMDCIDHNVVWNSFHSLTDECRKLDARFELDERAIHILKAYLVSYSYQREVLGHGLRDLRMLDPLAIFTWPLGELQAMHGSQDLSCIGIPQGGAISCIITNIVLHEADRAVERVLGHHPQNGLYKRFCDDMIIITSNWEMCDQALRAYQWVLAAKKLLMHEPVDAPPYGHVQGSESKFWGLKSIKPYLWGAKQELGIPWIQFLGYQIRYDGLVRIRKKSIRKQFERVNSIVDKEISSIRRWIKGAGSSAMDQATLRKELLRRYKVCERRLIAIAVGWRKFGQPLPNTADEIMPMCWAKGFKGLCETRFIDKLLKELDRHRDRQLRRVWGSIYPYLEERFRHRNGCLGQMSPRYHGAPFSYHGQFVLSHQRNTAPTGWWDPLVRLFDRWKEALRSLF